MAKISLTEKIKRKIELGLNYINEFNPTCLNFILENDILFNYEKTIKNIKHGQSLKNTSIEALKFIADNQDENLLQIFNNSYGFNITNEFIERWKSDKYFRSNLYNSYISATEFSPEMEHFFEENKEFKNLLDKKIEFTYTESYGQGGMLDRTKLKFDLKELEELKKHKKLIEYINYAESIPHESIKKIMKTEKTDIFDNYSLEQMKSILSKDSYSNYLIDSIIKGFNYSNFPPERLEILRDFRCQNLIKQIETEGPEKFINMDKDEFSQKVENEFEEYSPGYKLRKKLERIEDLLNLNYYEKPNVLKEDGILLTIETKDKIYLIDSDKKEIFMKIDFERKQEKYHFSKEDDTIIFKEFEFKKDKIPSDFQNIMFDICNKMKGNNILTIDMQCPILGEIKHSQHLKTDGKILFSKTETFEEIQEKNKNILKNKDNLEI